MISTIKSFIVSFGLFIECYVCDIYVFAIVLFLYIKPNELMEKLWLIRFAFEYGQKFTLKKITEQMNKQQHVNKQQTNTTINKFTVACAESCTGGNISTLLTSKSGASKWFRHGSIVYHIDEKVNRLNVDRTNAEQVDCVNKQVAEEMAKGLLKQGYALSVAITGYVGENSQKKHAFCWISVASPFGVNTICLQSDNKDNKLKSDSGIAPDFNMSRILCQQAMALAAVRVMFDHFTKHKMQFYEMFPNDITIMDHYADSIIGHFEDNDKTSSEEETF